MAQRPISRKTTKVELTRRIEEAHDYRKKWCLCLFYSPQRVLAFCVAFRLLNGLLIQTYFNPDEHWQSLEVAHRIVFGYGYLTWEWKKSIRSYLHPSIFVILYKTMTFFHLDTPWLMRKAPRLLQSIFSSFGDYYLYKYSCYMFGEQAAKWALFSQLTNWFMFYSSPRTLSNSLETVLTTMSLFYWPTFYCSVNHIAASSRKLAVALAALSCAVRPTSVITWLYIAILELVRAHDRTCFLLFEVAPLGALVIVLTCLLDRAMYGFWVFVPLNFIKFNLISSRGIIYGTHKWYWYFIEGFPVMLFSFLPFSALGVYLSRRWKLFALIIWVLALYSLTGHKEFRFVQPVLPVALMFAGYALAAIKNLSLKAGNFRTMMQLSLITLLATNIPMALYMSLVHQRGSEDVVNFLADEAFSGKVRSVLFLTPCHATPYYSTMHMNLPMRFLDCSPSDDGAIDDSDRFMMDPFGFISNMTLNLSSFSHVILFDSEEKILRSFLKSHSFREIKRFFHAHFKVDRGLQAAVVVFALRGID